MFEMCSKLKTTLLVVTHSQELANLADRQIKIVDGKIC
jgi:ABC-type lipoprotein export system ATPase subunit